MNQKTYKFEREMPEIYLELRNYWEINKQLVQNHATGTPNRQGALSDLYSIQRRYA